MRSLLLGSVLRLHQERIRKSSPTLFLLQPFDRAAAVAIDGRLKRRKAQCTNVNNNYEHPWQTASSRMLVRH